MIQKYSLGAGVPQIPNPIYCVNGIPLLWDSAILNHLGLECQIQFRALVPTIVGT